MRSIWVTFNREAYISILEQTLTPNSPQATGMTYRSWVTHTDTSSTFVYG